MADTEFIQESPSLKVDITQESNRLKVTIAGRIDEFAFFKKTLEKLLEHSKNARNISFDLASVNVLNSVGIRHWMLFLQEVEKIFTIEFLDVGEPFVEAGAMIQNMFGASGAPIHAFRAPYSCRACNLHLSPQLQIAALKSTMATEQNETEFRAPEQKCPQCKGALDFQGIEQEYFYLVSRKDRNG